MVALGMQVSGSDIVDDVQVTRWAVSNDSLALNGLTRTPTSVLVNDIALDPADFTQQEFAAGSFVGRYLTIRRMVRPLAARCTPTNSQAWHAFAVYSSPPCVCVCVCARVFVCARA